MLAELPEVTGQTRIVPQTSTVSFGDRQFFEHVNTVDPNFFKTIKLPLVEGTPANVFLHPDSVVVSQAIAHKYFGDADPVGKLLTFDATNPLTVTGVMRDLPYNTQLDGDIFIPFTSKAVRLGDSSKNNWFEFRTWTYVQLAPGADPRRVESKIPGVFGRHLSPELVFWLRTVVHESIDKFIRADAVPFHDVHLKADRYGGMKPGGSLTTIFGFAAIALLIMLIACFNFTNLATARAMMRAREVGLRKVVGARRRQLIAQFLGESVLTALLALVMALAIVEILLPAYDGFLGRSLALHYFGNWPLMLCVIAIAVVAGLVGGFYPALVLSGFRPAAALKPAAASQSGFGLFRMALVVFQFAISIGLGIAAIVVFAQIRYARHLDLGFNRDNIVAVDFSGAGLTWSSIESIVHTLASGQNIAGVALSDRVPFQKEDNFAAVTIPGNPQSIAFRRIVISPEFPTVYGMKLLGGRLLSRDRGKDISRGPGADISNGTNVIIDASAAHALGYTPESALGKQIGILPSHVTIVGVIQNALFHGARNVAVSPAVYYYRPEYLSALSIRVKGGHVPDGLAFIDATWHRFVPGVAIQRHFLDDSFDKLFAADEKQGTMFGIFVGIAIFIACLGLFGLAAFTAERRTKEIGIRKIMGARTNDIVRLLLWQFSVPVLIANLIAWPIAWYYLQHWLEGYAYRIELNPLYFVAAGTVALVIAWLTVVGHALRVARANPVHALRYE
jgi:putative ABC transport system permease protein